jgi:processive 1,2-diacylglycerol beta-glucosyltransferase
VAASRVLVLSAAIGEGHDLPARFLATGLEAAGARAEIADGLHAMGPFLERLALSGSPFGSRWGGYVFDAEYALLAHAAPARRLAGNLMRRIGGDRLLALIAATGPDIVVSTYPGVTELLGRLRAEGALSLPVVSAITDLAALRWWAHPAVDLHLVTHPESIAEVRSIAGPGAEVRAVHGLNDPAFLVARDRLAARGALGLPLDPPIVLVSGGGWGVGDLAGATAAALAADAHAVLLCGRNAAVHERMQARFAAEPRVTVLGFSDRMPDLLAAADCLVHSTAGLTVLEAIQRGCPAISYGWGHGHVRVNNRAFAAHGLAAVATTPAELAPLLRRALREPRKPDLSFAELPSATEVVLGRFAPTATARPAATAAIAHGD